MSFTTWSFFVFLLVVLLAYRVLPQRAQNLLLLGASYVFYGSWNTRFLFLLVLSSVLYFASGALIHGRLLTRGERALLSAWVVLSCALLVVLRWDSLDWRLPWLGLRVDTGRGPLVFASLVGLTLVANLAYRAISTLPAETRARVALWGGIGANLAILLVFKYFNFLADIVESLLRGLGAAPSELRLNLALPVGISFYTFQGMTYVIDIRRKRLAPTPRYSDFALFLAFFPLVLAGPIERAGRLLPQITGERTGGAGQIGPALLLILQGLFKKAVIADGVAVTANVVFGATAPATWADAVIGTLAFAIQLYADFSGYSDMAKGIASLFGISLTQNFRQPYFAGDPADFWTRWHVSLSSWFRDYVFFPLGGPYGSPARWIRNVLATFLVTGLWHGAAWNFVLWGLYHGALLCLHRLKQSIWKPGTPGAVALPAPLGIALFFALTCYGWVLFRCRSLEHVAAFTAVLAGDFLDLRLTASLPLEATLVALPLFVFLEVVGFRSREKPLDQSLPLPVWTACCAIMIFTIILGAGSVSTQFVYFTF